MPFHRPIPESKRRGKAGSSLPAQQAEGENAGGPGILGAWVQAEKMMQIALMLPSAAFIGWVIGYGLDRWLHQTWIAMIGIVVGILSGLVGAIRMAMVYAADPKPGGKTGDGADSGNPS
jgi:F0F1-type ATP synthase assembly protein I